LRQRYRKQYEDQYAAFLQRKLDRQRAGGLSPANGARKVGLRRWAIACESLESATFTNSTLCADQGKPPKAWFRLFLKDTAGGAAAPGEAAVPRNVAQTKKLMDVSDAVADIIDFLQFSAPLAGDASDQAVDRPVNPANGDVIRVIGDDRVLPQLDSLIRQRYAQPP